MIEWITSIFEKNRHDQFVLLDLWKRSTLIESIPSIFKKDWPWLNRSCRSLKKIDGSYSIFFMIESIFRSQKTIDSIENLMIEFPTLPSSELQLLILLLVKYSSCHRSGRSCPLGWSWRRCSPCHQSWSAACIALVILQWVKKLSMLSMGVASTPCIDRVQKHWMVRTFASFVSLFCVLKNDKKSLLLFYAMIFPLFMFYAVKWFCYSSFC